MSEAFQRRRRRETLTRFAYVRAADLEIGDTAGLETCPTEFVQARGGLHLEQTTRLGHPCCGPSKLAGCHPGQRHQVTPAESRAGRGKFL